MRKLFENIVGKGENAGNPHFLHATMFSILPNTEIIILAAFDMSSANAFNLDQTKILLFSKEIKSLLEKGLNSVYQHQFPFSIIL